MSQFGKTILLTRPQSKRAERLKREFEADGLSAIHIPLIEITDPSDNYASLDSALSHLQDYDWLIFTSQNAVEHFFARPSAPSAEELQVRVAAVGPHTAKLLQDLGVDNVEFGELASSKGLLKHLESFEMEGKRILFPRAKEGKKILIEGLKRRGAEVVYVEAYQTVEAKEVDKERFTALFQENKIDIVQFASPSSVAAFFSILDPKQFENSKVEFLTQGATTEESLEEFIT